MATSTQNDSRRSSSSPQQTSPATPSPPPSHPPLQHDDPQHFRDYVNTIDFDSDDFSIDDMFANPMPLPQHEPASIILAAEEFQRRRLHDDMFAHATPIPQSETPRIVVTAEEKDDGDDDDDDDDEEEEEEDLQRRPVHPTPLPKSEIYRMISTGHELQRRAQDYPPVRGTGLGKTEGRPSQQKRVRFDTPDADDEHERSHVESVKESPNGENARPHKRVRVDTPQSDHEKPRVDSVLQISDGGSTRPQVFTDREKRLRAEESDEEGDSSDDCAWSVDTEHGGGRGGGEEGKKIPPMEASLEHDSNVVDKIEH
jgi:hypothetical protein